MQHRVWGHGEEVPAWAFSEAPVDFIILICAGFVPSGVSGLTDVLEPRGMWISSGAEGGLGSLGYKTLPILPWDCSSDEELLEQGSSEQN